MELKPCPFCGQEIHPNNFGKDFPEKHLRGYYIECECCGFSFWQDHKRPNGQIGDWNTRPIEDELRARIAELEAKPDPCLTCWLYISHGGGR